jgi:hypothetical protein
VGIWQEADNLVKWNPNSLLNAPGNWNPLVYAANDPVNFVDPSGRIGLPAAMILGGAAMGFGSVVGQRLLDGNYRNARSAFTSGFMAGMSSMLFGGVGGAIISAGGKIGLLTPLHINPVTSFIGGLIGLAVDNLISFSSAFGKESMTNNLPGNISNSHNVNIDEFSSNNLKIRGAVFDKSGILNYRAPLNPDNYSFGNFNF